MPPFPGLTLFYSTCANGVKPGKDVTSFKKKDATNTQLPDN